MNEDERRKQAYRQATHYQNNSIWLFLGMVVGSAIGLVVGLVIFAYFLPPTTWALAFIVVPILMVVGAITVQRMVLRAVS